MFQWSQRGEPKLSRWSHRRALPHESENTHDHLLPQRNSIPRQYASSINSVSALPGVQPSSSSFMLDSFLVTFVPMPMLQCTLS